MGEHRHSSCRRSLPPDLVLDHPSCCQSIDPALTLRRYRCSSHTRWRDGDSRMAGSAPGLPLQTWPSVDAEPGAAELQRMAIHFGGEYDELKRLVAGMKCVGEWSEPTKGCVRFRTRDGATFNWFTTTGTINFQGPDPAKSKLEAKLKAALEAEEQEAEGVVLAEVDLGEDEPTIKRPSREGGTAPVERKKVFVVHG